MSNRKRTRQERQRRRSQWLNRRVNQAALSSIEGMQSLLEGVTWQNFRKSSTQFKSGITFRARAGTHMGRSFIAIMAKGQFIALRSMTNQDVWTWAWSIRAGKSKLDPHDKHSGVALEKVQFNSNDWGKGEYIIQKQEASDAPFHG